MNNIFHVVNLKRGEAVTYICEVTSPLKVLTKLNNWIYFQNNLVITKPNKLKNCYQHITYVRMHACLYIMLSCPQIIISEYNQTSHTSPSCYYVLDLLCVTLNAKFGNNVDLRKQDFRSAKK